MSKITGAKASKWATVNPADINDEPQNAKERIQNELRLLHVRKQAITDLKKTNNSSNNSSSKIKKAANKKGLTKKQKQKIAKAMTVMDKEEKKIEIAKAKAEKRKLGKHAWQ